MGFWARVRGNHLITANADDPRGVELALAGEGGGLNVGAWEDLPGLVGEEPDVDGNWPETEAVDVPSEVVVYGFFGSVVSGQPAIVIAAPNDAGHNVGGQPNMEAYNELPENTTDSTIFLKAIIPAGVPPMLRVSTSGVGVTTIQRAQRRLLA